MSHSLLHYPRSTVLALAGFFILVISFAAHSDNSLFASAGGGLFPEQYEGQPMTGMHGQDNNTTPPGYYEGDAALQKLTESALKYWWKAVVQRDPGLERYSAVVSGQFATRHNGVDYGLHLTTDSIKLRVVYSF